MSRKSKPKPFKLTITVTEPMVIMPYRRYLERVEAATKCGTK